MKKDKYETEPASYRPLDLLGCDLKVFIKILANRLNKCIAGIIHHDQTGIIPGRFSFFNVRRLMNIMYSRYDKDSKISILALYAQKAFDQVEWKYDLPESSLPALHFSLTRSPTTIAGNSFIVTSSLRIWYQIRKSFNLPETSVCTPLCHNHTFPASLTDSTLQISISTILLPPSYN